MAEYVGLDKSQPIPGTLQHGWNALDGSGGAPAHIDFPIRYVWSSVFARRGESMGYRNYRIVGSPWAYLCKMNQKKIKQASVSPSRQGTIFFPFHGWEGAGVVGDYSSLIDEIKRVEGENPVTICLYWLEYEDTSIRSLFEDAGFRVVTNGHRDVRNEHIRNQFLDVQLNECLKHKKVASNRMCTAIMYGASVGCDVGVYGDPMELDKKDSPVNFVPERIELMYPDLIAENIENRYVQELALRQLGADALLSPRELAMELGWHKKFDGEG